MKVLSIISSPLQLLNFKEYIKLNNIKNYDLIVLSFIKKEEEQITYSANVLKLKIHKKINRLSFLQYFQLKIFSKTYDKYNQLVIGNFFSDPHLFLYHTSKIKDLVVLDDGINTSLIDKYYKTEKKILKSNFFKKLIFNFLKIKTYYPIKFTMFTLFDIHFKSNNIIHMKNNFSYVKSLIKSFNDDDNTYLVGQPFIELNMITDKDYEFILTKIKSQHNKIVYIPSRKESDFNLEKIHKKFGFEILKTISNIELHFIENGLIPKKIIGFNSSALITLNNIFNSKENLINIISYKIDIESNRFSSNNINKYYEKIKDSKIKILKLL